MCALPRPFRATKGEHPRVLPLAHPDCERERVVQVTFLRELVTPTTRVLWKTRRARNFAGLSAFRHILGIGRWCIAHVLKREGYDSDSTKNQMSIIGWIILGLIAGWIANKIVEGSGQGFFLNIALGIVGALVGGFLYAQILGGPGVTGVNIGSIIVSIIGAIIVLWVYNAIAGRRAL